MIEKNRYILNFFSLHGQAKLEESGLLKILFCLTTDVSLSHIELEIVEKLWYPRSLLKALDTFLL